MMVREANQNQSNASIYLIEDNFEVRDYIIHFLEGIGYTVHGFDNAELAYNSIATNKVMHQHVHVVILDAILGLHRDRKPAEEFLVKMAETSPQTRIIVMSGKQNVEEFFELIFLGAADYFVKPPSNEDLQEIVKKHVDISRNQWQYSADPWPPTNRTNREIFLCYSSNDILRARGLARLLENSDLRVWYADQELPPGSIWEEMLSMALNRCPVFLCLISKAALKSEWVLKEINNAIFRKKQDPEKYLIIPILYNIKLDDVIFDNATVELKCYSSVDFSDGGHLADSFWALRGSIQNFLKTLEDKKGNFT
jgi:FixJ family two-component response regulator